MTKESFYAILGDIDEKQIKETGRTIGTASAKRTWIRWGSVAACFCLVVLVGAWTFLSSGNSRHPVLTWSEGFEAAHYFAYHDDKASSSLLDRSVLAPAAERSFSDDRAAMEAEEVIPILADHPVFTCVGSYREDGTLEYVSFTWSERETAYSELTITAGRQEIEGIQDCLTVETDADGNIVPTAVTVTERDGVSIVAEGSEKQNKTITFCNDSGWYQISGSWNDSYEAVVQLLDWVWEHPVDFDRFAEALGAEYTSTTLEAYPNALSAYIPDFQRFGYELGENWVLLKDGKPVRFEGHYAKAQAEDSATIHWYVTAEPDFYDRQASSGDLSELTEEEVKAVLSEKSHLSFMMDDVFLTVYAKEAQAEEVWQLIASLAD